MYYKSPHLARLNSKFLIFFPMPTALFYKILYAQVYILTKKQYLARPDARETTVSPSVQILPHPLHQQRVQAQYEAAFAALSQDHSLGKENNSALA